MLRESTWERIGTTVETAKDLESVLTQSKLDYTVIKKPVFLPTVSHESDSEGNFPMVYNQIPKRYATVRANDGRVYDVVSDRYEVVQNRDAFDFVNYMQEDIQFLKAGETESGMVYIIARMGDVNILGDSFTPHVIFRNGFTGLTRITAAICPLRIVCKNQFNFAFKNTRNKITIKHTGSAYDKLDEARDSLKMCADYMVHLNDVAEQYAGIKFDRFKMNAILNELFPVDDTDITEYKRTLLTDAKMRFLKAYDADDNYNFRGTGWGLVNAYTDFITHTEPRSKRSTRYENQFIRTTFDTNMNRIIDVVNDFSGMNIAI